MSGEALVGLDREGRMVSRMRRARDCRICGKAHPSRVQVIAVPMPPPLPDRTETVPAMKIPALPDVSKTIPNGLHETC